jgi:hypothetical protein
MNRRIIKGVLHNFLGTYTSRYSDFNGYWLFGLLVEDLGRIGVDLLDASGERKATPWAYAEWLASQKFAEQIGKAHLPKAWFREARLDITRSADTRLGLVNARGCSGYDVRFLTHVVTDLGRTYDSTASIFVAPHDPKVESRSGRAA